MRKTFSLIIPFVILALFLGMSVSGYAAPITIDFRVDLYAKFDPASLSYDPSFTPYSISVQTVFDTGVMRVETYSHDTIIYFGENSAISPLTQTLPLGLSGSPISPSEGHRPTILSNYDYGPGETGSQLSILENQYERVGEVEWEYHFGLRSSALYPPVADPLSFGEIDLLTYLAGLKTNQIEFNFSEYTILFDTSTLQYIGGVMYDGRAYIEQVNTVPEPSTMLLLGSGLIGLAGYGRKKFFKK